MGKYMKKARGGRGVMDLSQGPSGVKTRARSQAIQEELDKGTSSDAKLSPGSAGKSLVPAQVSYLELRSRRLEKVVVFAGTELPSYQKGAASVGECRRLSDLTNSEIVADDTSCRLALSLDEGQHTQRRSMHQMYDENQQLVQLFHNGNNEAADESSLHGFVQRSLRQWARNGRSPPGVAHSRSNSRSNSVTREFPSVTRELLPHGIVTRNQRKLENQTSSMHMEMETDALCQAKADSLFKNVDVEVSLDENHPDVVWSAVNRGIQEETQSSNTKECNAFTAEDINPSWATCVGHTVPSLMQSPFDMEIEDFFSRAEQQVHRHFRDRYNFDPQKGIPLPGRYEWVEM